MRAPRPSVEFAEESGALPIDQEKVTRLLDRAFDLYHSGSIDQAFEVCRAALRLYPDSATGHSLLATMYEKQGQIDAAIRQMQRVVELNPESTADRNRLEGMLRQSRLLNEPIAVKHPKSSVRQLVLNNPLVLSGLGVLSVLLAGVLLYSMRGGQEVVAPPAGSSQFASRQEGQASSGVQPAPTVSGSVFDGLGVSGNSTVQSRTATRSASEERESPSPSPQNTITNAAVSAPQTQPRRTQAPPAPTVTPSPPTVTRMTITHTPSVQPKPSPAPAQTTGRDYQRLATEAKRNGERSAAADNFRKAISTYRADLDRDSSSFEAQQGIRSCQLELKLLGETE